jgi:nuclear pore complex protein Nup54
VQVLRNRGYALDGAEEELKGRLEKLEKSAFEPVVGGRQEELWARMTIVRERARTLKAEMERLGAGGASAGDGSGEIDEGTMEKVRQVSLTRPSHLIIEEVRRTFADVICVMQILTDYDAQLAHLRKELDMINKEFEDWTASERPASTAGKR